MLVQLIETWPKWVWENRESFGAGSLDWMGHRQTCPDHSDVIRALSLLFHPLNLLACMCVGFVLSKPLSTCWEGCQWQLWTYMTYQLAISGEKIKNHLPSNATRGAQISLFWTQFQKPGGYLFRDSRPGPCSHSGVGEKTRQLSFTINGVHAQWAEEPVSKNKSMNTRIGK